MFAHEFFVFQLYGILDFLDVGECLIFLLLFAEHGLQVLADGLHFGIVFLFVLSYICLSLFSEVVFDNLVLYSDFLHYVLVLVFAALFLLHVERFDLAFEFFPFFLAMAICFSLVLALDGFFFLPQELVNRTIKLSYLSLIVRFDLFDLVQMAQEVVLILCHKL